MVLNKSYLFFPAITWNMMKFRVNLEDKSVDFINGLFLILKHIIHKCKVLKTVPQFNVFKKDIVFIDPTNYEK